MPNYQNSIFQCIPIKYRNLLLFLGVTTLWRNDVGVSAYVPVSPKSTSTKTAFQMVSTAIPVPNSMESVYEDDNASTSADFKVGVLMLNLGGPETVDDVEGFLYNLFADPDIIRLPGPLSPLQSVLAYGISKRRSPKSIEAYKSIGGGSPILKYSKDQGDLIEKALKRKYDLSAKCYIGMRYWHPFTDEALDQIIKDEVDALVILPLYPQFSISTSGSSLRVLQEEFAKSKKLRSLQHTVVDKWYDRPGYVYCMANLINKELDAFTSEQLKEGNGKKHVLFSAHGVPKSYIEAGDPYQEQIVECVEKISDQLPVDVEVHLSYQSRVGPIEWLRPYTDDVLPQLGADGVKNLVVVPISFVSEHIETLEEIDIEYRELAEENGVTNWRRCPALNTDAGFIEDMADLVMDALSEPSTSVTEACVRNNCEIEMQPFNERMGISTDMGNSSTKRADAKSMIAAELINARLAMVGVAGTMLLELLNGKSLLRLFGMM